MSARAEFEGIDTILIVEDDAEVRRVICRGLEALGYEIIAATNGEDALQAADRHCAPIHLVISDVVMPTMNGRELFEKLRGWYPAIRFLFISGYAAGPGSDIVMDTERTNFLPKPFTVNELARASRALLDQTSAARPHAAVIA